MTNSGLSVGRWEQPCQPRPRPPPPRFPKKVQEDYFDMDRIGPQLIYNSHFGPAPSIALSLWIGRYLSILLLLLDHTRINIFIGRNWPAEDWWLIIIIISLIIGQSNFTAELFVRCWKFSTNFFVHVNQGRNSLKGGRETLKECNKN